MLFVVIAKDGTDPEAPTRRQRVRETHLEGARALATEGTLQVGGALLDAPDEAAARALLEADVYHRSGVWRSYEVYPFRRAV